MEIIKKKLSELRTAPYNPRKITPFMLSKLKASLSEFGYVEPIIWNKNTGNVVGGNQRLRALIETGHADEEYDVVVVDMDETKEKALNIALNKVNGEWEDDKIDLLIKEIEAKDATLLALTGFEDSEIAKILNKELKDEDFDADAALAKPKYDIKAGEIWQLGAHRVMCGDSTKREDVEKLMDGKKADMVITDPPYGIGFNYNSHKDEGGELYEHFCDDWFNIIKSICNQLIIFTGWSYNKFWFNKNPYDTFYWVVKNKHSGGKNSRFRNTEPIMMWGRFKNQFNFDYILDDSIKILDGPAGIHTCPKPVKMFSEFIQNAIDKDQRVLDIFLGSGTTLIACEQTNHSCYGMEIDPLYCSVIIERWEILTGKKGVKIENDINARKESAAEQAAQ